MLKKLCDKILKASVQILPDIRLFDNSCLLTTKVAFGDVVW